ncbi:MAG: ornithine carbamoyltransferase [Actinomycetota bacterium]
MDDFLRVTDRTGPELAALAERAAELATLFKARRLPPTLTGRRIGMWWDGPGFRNRVAFELGATALGATVVGIPGPLADREPLADRARYLDNWLDAVVVRTPLLADLDRLAEAAEAPIVNARTTDNHPCEILGDLAFSNAHGHPVDQPLHLVFVGAAGNLHRSWMAAAQVLPITVTHVCPLGYEGGELDGVTVVRTLADAPLENADIVYTDCWPQADTGAHADTWPQADTGAHADCRPQADTGADACAATEGAGGAGGDDVAERFGPLRITAAVLDRCRPEALFLPCPPVTRGQEVDDDALAHPICRVIEAKAWLLHAQNALLVSILT